VLLGWGMGCHNIAQWIGLGLEACQLMARRQAQVGLTVPLIRCFHKFCRPALDVATKSGA
jgi:hypothetical protein